MMGPRIVPAEIPAVVLQDPKRRAEVQVFERLRDAPLLKGFTIYYSCWWLAEHNEMLRDGEADFIAAHPDIGFIALEVKGGVVSRSIDDNSWLSRGAKGKVHSIQDPVAQARKSKKVILDALKREWPESPFIWARHGVILPHSSRPKAVPHLGAAMPLDIFAFEEDMPALGARLLRMLMWRPAGSKEKVGMLGQRGIDILDGFYGRDFSLERDLIAQIEFSEREIVELTEQQKRVLDMLSLQTRALVVGGAGTGKTVLANEKAARSAQEGKSVLLVCFNKPLSLRIHRNCGPHSGITVETFHGCCTRVAEAAGLRPQRHKAKSGKSEYYSNVLPALLREAVGGGQVPRYDTIIVDEGQDFRTEWFRSLRQLLGDGGSFFVFADANQSIYNKCDLIEAVGAQPSLLCDNIRNTRQVFEAMSRFYRGPKQDGRGPDGPEIRWVSTAGDNLRSLIEDQINELTLVEGIPPEQIAVLTGCAVGSSVLSEAAVLGEHPVTNASEPRAGHIVLDSVHRFKGLDSPVVLLVDMDQASAEPELPYVALSRAKSLLVLIGRESTLKFLEAGIAEAAAA